MNERAYMTMSLIDGKSEEVFRSFLKYRPGIVAVDVLDGPPDVMLVIEAKTREKLAQLMTDVLTDVEPLIDNFNLLPVQNTSIINYRVRPVMTGGDEAGTQSTYIRVMRNRVQIIQERLQPAVS